MMMNNITVAAALLRQGKLVAFPTETVYGLGADASNAVAVSRIFQVKKRPDDHPLIVHISDISELEKWARDIPPMAFKLAQAFWPGPLSIILKKQPHVLDIVTAGQRTVGLRIPRHPVAMALLKEFGSGIAAPSANLFTHVSPTTTEAVRAELGKEVDLILEGGACEVGLESTIIDLSHDVPIILRPGMITPNEISAQLGQSVSMIQQDTPFVRVPGRHHLHYAPTTKTVILNTQQINEFLRTIQPHHLPLAIMRYTGTENKRSMMKVIPMPNNATQYAHDLYQTLRLLDTGQFKQIIIEAVPMTEEWGAIRDRLFKASGSL
ncbi:MAG: threonylcarbamoyl-AMP synthase [Gammaproteobacteria bacterium RIFCSPHIGHO2_12_FULL_37_14]|nr:MAG: threonylcarbamoyl-AMP synthase [Gammaproteobacteria bacterium RIFCSPHIGHO2_12_FULL_37_14]